MTASIKEALEQIRSLSSLDDKLIAGTSIVVCQRVAEIHQHADAALASLTASPDREKVARWHDLLVTEFGPNTWNICFTEAAWRAFTDAILSTIAPDEAAIRAAAFEEAAKICDQIRNNAERRAAQHENVEARNSALDKMEGAIQCAAAIRSQEAGR